MSDRLAFRHEVRFTLAENERFDKEPFHATLRAKMFTQGWDFYMGALGGRVATFGVVFQEPTGDMTVGDIEHLATWLPG